MPIYHPEVPPPPQPTKIFFDPYNSTSTGHQVHQNLLSGATSWRESRTYKLAQQFGDTTGHGGSEHVNDLVGAGSENWRKDGRKDNGDWEKGAPGLREEGWQDIRGLLSGSRKRSHTSNGSNASADHRSISTEKKIRLDAKEHVDTANSMLLVPQTCGREADHHKSQPGEQDATPVLRPPLPPQIFRGLTIFLNGSTAPLVSDHKLKQLFVSHGGNASLALGRRSVTHVILGNTCGGGLASSKIHKEVALVRGKGIKYVTAQWILDSVEKGVRQSEGNYQQLTISKRIGGSGQMSVAGMFAKAKDRKG